MNIFKIKREILGYYTALLLMLVNPLLILLFSSLYFKRYINNLHIMDGVLWSMTYLFLIVGTYHLYVWLKTPLVETKIIGFKYSPKAKYTGHFKNLTKFRPIIRYKDENNRSFESVITNLGAILPEEASLKLRIRNNKALRPTYLVYFAFMYSIQMFFMTFIESWTLLLSFFTLETVLLTIIYTSIFIQIRDIPPRSLAKHLLIIDPKPQEYETYSASDFQDMKQREYISQKDLLSYRHYKGHNPKELALNLFTLLIVITYFWSLN